MKYGKENLSVRGLMSCCVFAGLCKSRQDDPFRAGEVRPGRRDWKPRNNHRRRLEDGERGFHKYQILSHLQLSPSSQSSPMDYRWKHMSDPVTLLWRSKPWFLTGLVMLLFLVARSVSVEPSGWSHTGPLSRHQTGILLPVCGVTAQFGVHLPGPDV